MDLHRLTNIPFPIHGEVRASPGLVKVRLQVNVQGDALNAHRFHIVNGVTPPFVKNCTLRPEFTRGIVLYPVDWTDAGQVLDLIMAAPEAALQKLRRCGYFRLAA
jgi:hypothetical protein